MKPKDEELATKEMLREFGFNVSSVRPDLLNDFHFRAPFVIWMRVPYYSLLKDVLAQMEAEEYEPAHPFDFIGKIVNTHPIVGSRICLFKTETGWGSLVATEYGQGKSSERSLVSIMSGDGFGPNCYFAVKPKGAHQ